MVVRFPVVKLAHPDLRSRLDTKFILEFNRCYFFIVKRVPVDSNGARILKLGITSSRANEFKGESEECTPLMNVEFIYA
jgi:hypothetical protein